MVPADGRSGLRKTTIAGVPAEIRTENLPDTSVQRYRYADPIRSCLLMTRDEVIFRYT
jgi:hypothetical protein